MTEARLEQVARWQWNKQRRLDNIRVMCGKRELNGRQLCSGDLAIIWVQRLELAMAKVLVNGVYRAPKRALKVYRAGGDLRLPRTARTVAHVEKFGAPLHRPISLTIPFDKPLLVLCPRCGELNQIDWDADDADALNELRKSAPQIVSKMEYRRLPRPSDFGDTASD